MARHRRSQAGFSIMEIVLAGGIMSILSATAVLQIGAVRPGIVGDGGMRTVMSSLNTARQLAITERRYIQVIFEAPDHVEIVREEVPGPTTTVLSKTLLSGGLQYELVEGLPDTPDAVGASAPIFFGSATTIKFAPDGTLVSQAGATINGTVFLALPNAGPSARAVTVLGSTGRVRGYRWDGREWKLV